VNPLEAYIDTRMYEAPAMPDELSSYLVALDAGVAGTVSGEPTTVGPVLRRRR
jgi:hypothetical protein